MWDPALNEICPAYSEICPALNEIAWTISGYKQIRVNPYNLWLIKMNPNFEGAADAIVNGDVATLVRLLDEEPQLIHQRSTREHRCTLLHYVGANGVEGYRQKSPPNAVELAELLLERGAEV